MGQLAIRSTRISFQTAIGGALCLVCACGDRDDGFSASVGRPTSGTGVGSSSGTAGSDGNSGGTTRADPTGDGGTSGTGGTPTTGGSSGSSGSTGGATGSGPRFDVGAGSTGTGSDSGGGTGNGGCGTGPAMVEFSYLWVSNTGDGTVSKVDTQTATEVGRYRTAATNQGPSRTSVNLAGDVAVLNRGTENAGSGQSVIKIGAVPEHCADTNGTPGIQTSSGPTDVLPWGEDECVLWSNDLPTFATPNGGGRAIAWDGGQNSADPCDVDQHRLFVGWSDPSIIRQGKVRVFDGLGNQIGADITLANWSSNFVVEGPYGGATDSNGNFWAMSTSGLLYRIDGGNFGTQRYQLGVNGGSGGAAIKATYGIAMDTEGHPWVAGHYTPASAFEFDPAAGTFGAALETTAKRFRGMAIDSEGIAWIAVGWQKDADAFSDCGIAKIDTVAGTVLEDNIPLTGCVEPVGVSVDFEGYVWVVDFGSESAYKVDPGTHAIVATVPGFNQPYTYSDMTGEGLRLVNPPIG